MPNKAPEPTTTAVTIRAPSSTARASRGRGSSLTLGMKDRLSSLITLHREHPLLVEFVSAATQRVKLDQFGALVIDHFPEDGFSLYFEECGVLRTIFLHSGHTADGVRYRGVLPGGVSFDSGRGDALLRFGAPDRSGSGWDRWIHDGAYLHLKYSKDGASIETIRIFTLDTK